MHNMTGKNSNLQVTHVFFKSLSDFFEPAVRKGEGGVHVFGERARRPGIPVIQM